MSKIRDTYAQPSKRGSLGGVARYARAQKVPIHRVRRALERDVAYTLHKPVRRTFPTTPVIVMGIDQQWAADLVDMQKLSRYNKGHKYLMTVIDIFSKYAWVEPLHDKSGPKVAAAWKKVLKRASPRQPHRLQTDKGTEFYNASVQALFKARGIHHFSTSGDAKASVVERFNRTLKERLYRYFTAANTYKYLDIVQTLVDEYNVSYHRSIGMTPRDVTPTNEAQVWHTLYKPHLKQKKKKPPKFKVGDQVRLSQARRPFKKGYLPQWTEEVFEVVNVYQPTIGPVTYKVQELDGTLIQGTFYTPELQKVHVDDTTVWRVEKVLKRRGNQLYVQWKGWPKKYNSWIRQDDLV